MHSAKVFRLKAKQDLLGIMTKTFIYNNCFSVIRRRSTLWP